MPTAPYIIYNGVNSSDLGLRVESMSSFPPPVRQYDYYTVPGMDGQLVVDRETYEDVTIEVRFNLMHGASTAAVLNAWLTGTGELTHSDDPSVHYKVKAIHSNARYRYRPMGRDYDSYSVVFVCEPYRYAATVHITPTTSGTTGQTTFTNTHNTYTLPRITVSGTNPMTVTVNTDTVVTIASPTAMIDSDAKIVFSGSTNLNIKTTLVGEWPIFRPGENTVQWTNVTNIDIVPRWRDL